MNKVFFFPTPNDLSPLTLQPDSMASPIPAVPDTHVTGRLGVSFTIPSTVPDSNGAALRGPATYDPQEVRGILILNGDDSFLRVDDIHFAKRVVCPDPIPPTPIPPVPPNATPWGIIKAVWATGRYELVTKAGCGIFTEACCTALHTQDSPNWGHIRKTGAQNQYNGHAVDAVMLLVGTAQTQAGIYDIISDSESTNAKPAFNFSGPPVPTLWFYPAAT